MQSCFSTWSGRPACSGWWYKKAQTEWGTSHEPTLDHQGQHSCHHWYTPSEPGQGHSNKWMPLFCHATVIFVNTFHRWFSYLWPIWHVFSTVSYESDSLHASVRKSCVAHKLRQALHCILERINSSCEVRLESVHWGKSDEEKEEVSKQLSNKLKLNQDNKTILLLVFKRLSKKLPSYSLTMCPVVWKASSTIVSSWSEAAWWNTEKMFFQPERMFAAWEFTIWATHLITMSLIVGDLLILCRT